MVTEAKLDLLAEVGRIARQLAAVRDEAQKVDRVAHQMNDARLDYDLLEANFQTIFHELTELMLNQGLEVDAEDPELVAIRQGLEEKESRRQELRVGLRTPFNELGDVLEYWS